MTPEQLAVYHEAQADRAIEAMKDRYRALGPDGVNAFIDRMIERTSAALIREEVDLLHLAFIGSNLVFASLMREGSAV